MMKDKIAEDAKKAMEAISKSQDTPIKQDTPIEQDKVGIVPEDQNKGQVTPDNIVEDKDKVAVVDIKEDKSSSSEVETLKDEVTMLRRLLEDKNGSTWESRYLTLQGINKSMVEELKGLKGKVDDIAKVEQDKLPINPSEAVNKLKEDYGETVIEDLKKLFVVNGNEELKDDLNKRVTEVESNQGKTVEELFFIDLGMQVPDWKKINGWDDDRIPTNPKWENFLNKQIPGTNLTYNSILLNNYNTYNAVGVAKIFNLFKESLVPEPKKEGEINNIPSIDNFIDPGVSGGGNELPKSNQKKIYPKSEIDAFYTVVTKGTFKGTKAERDALSDEYQAAIIEGRVQ